MRALAIRFDLDLRAAALADLQVQLGRLADHDDIRLHRLADGARRNALEALLVHHARDVDAAGKVAPILLDKGRRRAAHGRHGALHVGRAAAVDAAVLDLAAEGIVRPRARINDRHGVDVTVKQDRRTRAIAVHTADDVAVIVDGDLVEVVLMEKIREGVHDLPFLPGIALGADECLCERNHDFISTHNRMTMPFCGL